MSLTLEKLRTECVAGITKLFNTNTREVFTYLGIEGDNLIMRNKEYHGFSLDTWDNLESWLVYMEPREVTLYRYTYEDYQCTRQSLWRSDSWDKYSKSSKWQLLKTESKVVEL